MTYGAGGSTRDARPSRSSRASERAASRRWRTSPASARPSRAARGARPAARRRRRERARPARRPAAGRAEWTETEGGLAYSRELVELIRGELRASRSAPRASPRRTSTRPPPRTTCATSRRRSTPARLPHHPAVLRQPLLLRLRRPRPRAASTCRSCRASCRSRTGQVERMTELCGARDPAGLLDELERRRDEPAAVAELGVAQATPSAPTCWPPARPASTSTR